MIHLKKMIPQDVDIAGNQKMTVNVKSVVNVVNSWKTAHVPMKMITTKQYFKEKQNVNSI
jgi:hypothetical protein